MDLQKSYIRAVIQGNSIIEDENAIYHYEKIIYSGTPYLYIRYKESMYFSMIEEEIKKCSAFNTHPSYSQIFPYYKTYTIINNSPEVLLWYKGLPLIHQMKTDDFKISVFSHCRVILSKLAAGLTSPLKDYMDSSIGKKAELPYVIHGAISPYSILYSIEDGDCRIMHIHSIYIGQAMPSSSNVSHRLVGNGFLTPELIKTFSQSEYPLQADSYGVGLSLMYAIMEAHNVNWNELEKDRQESVLNDRHQEFINKMEKIILPMASDPVEVTVVKILIMMVQTDAKSRLLLSNLYNPEYNFKKLNKFPPLPGREMEPIEEISQFCGSPIRLREVVRSQEYIAVTESKTMLIKKISPAIIREMDFVKINKSEYLPIIIKEDDQFVMYNYEGKNLEDLYNGVSKTHSTFITMLFTFAGILNEFMNLKIVHGQLCPKNILEGKNEIKKFTGLLYAVPLNELAHPITFNIEFSTNICTAPELLQYDKKKTVKYHPKSDVFSLGMVFISVLTNTFDEFQLAHGLLGCKKQGIVSETVIVSNKIDVLSLANEFNKFKCIYSEVSTDTFKRIKKIIVNMIKPNPNDRPSVKDVFSALQEILFNQRYIQKDQENAAMSIVKNPGTPRYSISIDEFSSICSISDKDMKNSIGEIKECLKFNSCVTLIRSIKNHVQMKSIHKRFAHNKQTLMNNEITLLNKAAGMGVAYSLVYPRLLCKSDPDAGFDIIIEYCGIDLGLYYQNKNFKKGGESGVVFRDMVFTLSQLLNGLKEMGFYHGDIRIENIMRDKSKVKFIDFECGILDPKINNELEDVEISMYGLSPQYAPPELLDQFDKVRNHEPLRVYPRKIDIYCLARCFVLILTRKVNDNVVSFLSFLFNLEQSEVAHIFAEKNFSKLGLLIGNNYNYMLKLIADIPNPFSPSQNDKFTKFKGVLIKMLAKNPKDRSSSDEIINGLSQIII